MSVRKSLAWTYLAQALGVLVSFASTVVIARIVSPRDFGVFAMANAVSTIINVFMQFGLAKYLMREQTLTRDILRSAFSVNVMMSLIYVTAILIGSLTANRLFGSWEVGRFLVVFSIFPLFAMMEFIPSTLCAREMRFKLVSAIGLLRAIVIALATLILASAGFAYMSFAWAQVIGWLLTSTIYNVVVWRPDIWRFSLNGVRSILGFGVQMIGISGLSQLGGRGSEMVLGSSLGLSALGLYNRAVSLPGQVYSNAFLAGSNVVFSRLSKDLRETGTLHHTYFRFMRIILAVLWPLMFGLAVIAEPLVRLLYGDKWRAAAFPLSMLTVAFAITIGVGMTSEIFVLRHETRRQVRIEVVRTVIGFGLFAGGSLISLPAAAVGKVGEALITCLLYSRRMAKLVGGSKGEFSNLYAESSILCLAAIFPTVALMLHTGWSPFTPLPWIVGAVATGGLFWSILLVVRRHPIIQEVARFWPFTKSAEGVT